MIDDDFGHGMGMPAQDEPEASAGDQSPLRSKWVHLGTLFVVVVAGVALLAQGLFGAQEVSAASSPSTIASWELQNALLSCLTRQVTEVVPPNYSVSVVTEISETDPKVFDQLTRAVAPVRRIAPRGRDVIDLRLVRVRRPRGCLGVVVRARWPNRSVHFGSASLVGPGRLPSSE